MAEELFVPFLDQLPDHVQNEFDDDEVWALKNSNFHDVVDKGWSFNDLYAFARDRVLYLVDDVDVSVVSKIDPPSHHEYTVDTIFLSSKTAKKKTLHISGANTDTTSTVLSRLLEFFITSFKDNKDEIVVIFKCFASTPRKPFGTLNLESIPTILENSKCQVNLSFQFLAMEKHQCEAIFNSACISCVEFRQCTFDRLSECLGNAQAGSGPPKLKISLTKHEFSGLAQGLESNSSLLELDLLLHFIFDNSDVDHLTSALQGNQGLQRFCLEFLEMDDAIWKAVCASLHNHPHLKVLDIAFTDKFADGARRLNPERRRERTQAVLKLVQNNKILEKVTWPKFQQDEDLLPAIEKCLEENKSKNSL